jgi:broad specificity phosphatase PhoE
MGQFFASPERLVFGNETALQAGARFRSAIQTVLHLHAERTVAVVTHGTVLSLFVSELTGCDGFELWSKLSLPACVVLDVESRRLLELINLK